MATSEGKIEGKQKATSGFEKLAEKNEAALAGGGLERVKRHHASGKMTARERIEFLLDDGTFEEIDRFKSIAVWISAWRTSSIPATESSLVTA